MNDEILPCKFHGYSEMSWWKLISSRLVVSGNYIDFQLQFKWVVFDGYFSEVCERNKPYLRKWSNLTCVTIQDGPLPVLIRVITPLIGVLNCSYLVIRAFIGVLTPYVTGRAHLVGNNFWKHDAVWFSFLGRLTSGHTSKTVFFPPSIEQSSIPVQYPVFLGGMTSYPGFIG